MEEKCKFCELETTWNDKIKESVEYDNCFYIIEYNDEFTLAHDAHEDSEELEINYCPKCGRKL